MSTYLLVRYLHLISILLVVGSVFAQQFLVKRTLSQKTLKTVLLTDSIYGIAAIFTVAFGLTLWFGVGKPTSFYSDGSAIWIKLGLFTAVGLLSIYPTVFYIRNRKKEVEFIEVPKKLIYILRIEAFLLLLIPFFAELMVFGVDLFA